MSFRISAETLLPWQISLGYPQSLQACTGITHPSTTAASFYILSSSLFILQSDATDFSWSYWQCFKINQKNEDVSISLFLSCLYPSFPSFSSLSLHYYRNTNHPQNPTISHLLLISTFAVALCGKWAFLQPVCGNLKAITAAFLSS